MLDGAGQRVPSYPNTIARVVCVGWAFANGSVPQGASNPASIGRATALAECPSGSLAGSLDGGYRSGAARFPEVTIFGDPGLVYTLSVALEGLPPVGQTDVSAVGLVGAIVGLFNVSLLQCGKLEVFDASLRLCECGTSAERSAATGVCECVLR